MGLCASSALEHLEEFEQEEDEEEEEEEEECSYHIDSRASSARMSYSSSRNSRNSTNSLFKTLSFDSSRSSAEVGEMGQLGSLFCKRRGRGQGRSSLVGNNSSDIQSAHLTNLLSSILCKTSSDETKSPAEISFASYLSTPFIRPQGFEQHAIMMKQHDGLDAIAKSYAESAAKAAARDTFLFLNENDSSHNFQTSSGNKPDELQELQGGYALASCVPEENDITLAEEEEEEEDEEQDETDVAAAETSSEDSDPGTVDLFKPGMYYHEDELAQYTDQTSLFEFCFPATTSNSSSRWASVVNAARQSAACLAATRPLQIPPTQTLKKKQGQGEVEREDEGGANLSCVPGFELRAVVPTSYKADQDDGRGGGATSSSSAILGCAGSCCTSAELLRESSQDQPNCCNASPPPDILRNRRTTISREDCRTTLELQRTPPRNSEEQKDGSSTTNSQNNDVKLQDVDSGNVAQKLGCSRQGADLARDHGVRSKEGEQDSSANVGEQLLPSSQSGEDSKNPHQGWLDCPTSCLRIRIISAGKECSDLCCSSSSTCGNLIQDCEARIEDEEEKEEQDPDPDSFFSFPSSPSSKLFEEVGSGHIIEQMKSTKLMQEMACRKSTLEEFQGTGFDEEEVRHKEAESATVGKAPLPVSQATLETAAASSQTNFFDKKFFSQEQQQACNPAAAANSSKRFAASKSLPSTEDTSSNNPLDGRGGDESSCCESFDNDDNHHTLGIRIMRFAGKDFACFQIKKCFNGNAVADVPSSGGVTAAASASESAPESGNTFMIGVVLILILVLPLINLSNPTLLLLMQFTCVIN